MRQELTYDHGVHARAVDVSVAPSLLHRNRVTSAFRLILAVPHLILVGAPAALAMSFLFWPFPDGDAEFAGGGVLGVGVVVIAVIAWFAIVFTETMPRGLWNLSAFYLRWRVKAVAYIALLRDEYPPFGDGAYPVQIELPRYSRSRDRLSVGFRCILVLPHLLMIWILGIAWMVATAGAWFAILIIGRYPRSLYGFAIGVLRWSTDVEAYLLLLHDEYPSFSIA